MAKQFLYIYIIQVVLKLIIYLYAIKRSELIHDENVRKLIKKNSNEILNVREKLRKVIT